MTNEITYTIEKTKEGTDTIIIEKDGKQIPLHSKYFPSKESESLKFDFNPKKYDLLIVIGVGLGYHLLPLKKLSSYYSKIIFIDILSDLFSLLQNSEKTSFLTSFNESLFLFGKEPAEISASLYKAIDLSSTKGISILEHPQSLRAFSEYYNEVKEVINSIINKKAGNKATLKAFGSLYIRNILKNINFMNNHKSIDTLFNKFHGFPACVITSGPSLEIALDHLKKQQHTIFIIAVDSAFSLLQKSGITPDFVISIDPQGYIMEHFQGTIQNDTKYIFSISSFSSLLDKYQGYISLNTHPLSQLIETSLERKIKSIESHSGTVAGDAIAFAKACGFSSIGLLAFDFSFINYSIYAKGTAYQRRYSNIFQKRTLSVETQNMNYIRKSSKGFQYNQKPTRKSFIQYKESIEQMLNTIGSENIYNINKNGIPINGITTQELQKFIKLNDNNINKREIIDSVTKEDVKMSDLFSLKKFKNYLQKKEIIDELITASLGEKADKRSIKRCREMIKKMGRAKREER